MRLAPGRGDVNQTLLIDCAWTKPSAAAIEAAGYSGVIGYISHDPSKDLTAAQAKRYLTADLSVGLVFETTANRAAQGRAAGAEDCRFAETEARKRGYPAGCVIFYAVDFDAPPRKVLPYFRGIKATAKRYGWGPYGSARVIAKVDTKLQPAATWQTVAWSGGMLSHHADLYQRSSRSHTIKGVSKTSYDEDVLIRDVPLWTAGGEPGPDHHSPHHQAPVREDAPRVNVKRYSKSILAAVGALGTWATVALADGVVTGQEWTALGVAVATALGVYTVPNKQRKTS